MTEWLLLLLVGGSAAALIGWPLLGGSAGASPDAKAPDAKPPGDEGREGLLVRHRLALEALRDVEADRRAGSLDAAGYAAQRAEAEERAAATLAALDGDAVATPRPAAATSASRRPILLTGGILVAAVVVGFTLPPPIGLAERTVINRPLADAIAHEEARQAEIGRLLDRIAVDPRDAAALSALADAYLAGGSTSDRQRGAVALLALIALEPEDRSAYRRLITAYIAADDWTDASAALDAYAAFAAADEPDLPFFRGLIALHGEGDRDEAIRQFDRFLLLAPDDERAPMIRSLRAEAAGELGAAS